MPLHLFCIGIIVSQVNELDSILTIRLLVNTQINLQSGGIEQHDEQATILDVQYAIKMNKSLYITKLQHNYLQR